MPLPAINPSNQAGTSPPRNQDTGDIAALIERLDRLISVLELGKSAPVLVDVRAIASWLGLSAHTVRVNIVKQPGFPKAVLPTGTGLGQKRWFLSEVVEWVQDSRNSSRDRRVNAANIRGRQLVGSKKAV